MDKFALIVVGGMQSPHYSTPILTAMANDAVLSQGRAMVFPANPPWTVLSGQTIRHWLDAELGQSSVSSHSVPLVIWAFSAGCVGMVALVSHWQQYRGKVLACFALDGWGVPLLASVPTYRLSHDSFTHNTSGWLGQGPINFYADPAVPHSQLWQSPQSVMGWQVIDRPAAKPLREPLTAAEFLCHWTRHHLNCGEVSMKPKKI
jgi:hypothetical protein